MTDPHKSSYLGIAIPAFLHPAAFDDAWKEASRLAPRAEQAALAFNMGWHGLAYRARSSAEYAARLVALWDEHKGSSHEGNFLVDQAFVDYLFNAASAVECLAFSVYAALGLAFPETVKLASAKDLKVFRPAVLNKCSDLVSDHPLHNLGPLHDLLKKINDDSTVVQLFELRDVVTHRGTLRRTVTVHVGSTRGAVVTVPENAKALPADWISNFVVGPKAADFFQPWLEATLGRGPLLLHELLAKS